MTIGSEVARLVGSALGIGVMSAALLAVPQVTLARHGGGGAVSNTGTCSGSTTTRIKAKPDNGGLEVEFEVDSNRSGQTWHVVLKRDGSNFFSGNRMTQPPSGSFDLSRRTANPAGSNTLTGRATNAVTGEVCRAQVTL